jgi:hypothetical protein
VVLELAYKAERIIAVFFAISGIAYKRYAAPSTGFPCAYAKTKKLQNGARPQPMDR